MEMLTVCLLALLVLNVNAGACDGPRPGHEPGRHYAPEPEPELVRPVEVPQAIHHPPSAPDRSAHASAAGPSGRAMPSAPRQNPVPALPPRGFEKTIQADNGHTYKHLGIQALEEEWNGAARAGSATTQSQLMDRWALEDFEQPGLFACPISLEPFEHPVLFPLDESKNPFQVKSIERDTLEAILARSAADTAMNPLSNLAVHKNLMIDDPLLPGWLDHIRRIKAEDDHCRELNSCNECVQANCKFDIEGNVCHYAGYHVDGDMAGHHFAATLEQCRNPPPSFNEPEAPREVPQVRRPSVRRHQIDYDAEIAAAALAEQADTDRDRAMAQRIQRQQEEALATQEARRLQHQQDEEASQRLIAQLQHDEQAF